MPICSNCYEITSFTGPCGQTRNQPGGTYAKFAIIPACWISGYVEGTNGIIDDIVLDLVNNPTAQWFTVTAKKDTLTYEETINTSNNSVQQTFTFTISNYDGTSLTSQASAQAQSQWLFQLLNSSEGWVVVTRDKLGVRFLHGKNSPLFVSAITKTRGTVGTDATGSTITLTEAQSSFAPALDSTMNTTGVGPQFIDDVLPHTAS